MKIWKASAGFLEVGLCMRPVLLEAPIHTKVPWQWLGKPYAESKDSASVKECRPKDEKQPR